MLLNGREIAYRENLSVAEALKEAGYDPDQVALLLNQEILPRAEALSTVLKPDDVLEAVFFMGGGQDGPFSGQVLARAS
jgi:thiamine biosynthesis protein ThiS